MLPVKYTLTGIKPRPLPSLVKHSFHRNSGLGAFLNTATLFGPEAEPRGFPRILPVAETSEIDGTSPAPIRAEKQNYSQEEPSQSSGEKQSPERPVNIPEPQPDNGNDSVDKHRVESNGGLTKRWSAGYLRCQSLPSRQFPEQYSIGYGVGDVHDK